MHFSDLIRILSYLYIDADKSFHTIAEPYEHFCEGQSGFCVLAMYESCSVVLVSGPSAWLRFIRMLVESCWCSLEHSEIDHAVAILSHAEDCWIFAPELH